MSAQLVVTLVPTNGQWRFPWELGWRNSDEAATNLVDGGNYTIEFRNLNGYLAPPVPATVSGITHVTNEYLPTLTNGGPSGLGALTVNMGLNPPPNAAWRFLGETDADWRAPGLEVREEKLLREIGYQVRSGVCTVRDRSFVFLDRDATAAHRMEVLLDELSQRDLGEVYVSPELRRILGKEERA